MHCLGKALLPPEFYFEMQTSLLRLTLPCDKVSSSGPLSLDWGVRMRWEVRAKRGVKKWGNLALTPHLVDFPSCFHSEYLDLRYHLTWRVLRAWLPSVESNWGGVVFLRYDSPGSPHRRLWLGQLWAGSACLYRGPLSLTQQRQAWVLFALSLCSRRCWLLLPPGDTHDFLETQTTHFSLGF